MEFQNKNLRTLSDVELLQNTRKLVEEERAILSVILRHLGEIDRRKLYSAKGFPSLFEYAQFLGYPEDQAYRRISAMKLIKEIPEVEKMVDNGLSLTHVNLAQTLFRQNKKRNKEFSVEPLLSKSEKVSILKQLENKSTREAEKIILTLSPEPQKFMAEKMRLVSSELTEIKFVVDKTVKLKIERLRGLLAHSNPQISLAELVEKLCDLGLKYWDPINKKSTTAKSKVWKKAQGKCEICSSEYALEIDHIFPKAKGGESTMENLRLLCRSCNQRSAIIEFGQLKMDQYLS